MKDIMLKIKDSDGLEFVTEGRLYSRGEITLIQYDETDLSGYEGCTTSLTITPTHVRMKRSGENLQNATEMIFEKGRRMRGTYATPFGNFGMEILTNKITGLGTFAETQNALSIDYTICLKGLMDASKELNIEVFEKGRS